MPDTFPFFPPHPNPCDLLALQQLHRSHTARPQSSRKTTARGCKHLGETNASSPKRFPPPALALAMAYGPETALFLPWEQQTLRIQTSTRLTVLFHSDLSCLCHPLPWPTHTTEHFGALSKRLHSQNTGWSNTLNAQHIWLPRINYVPLNPNDFSNNFLTEFQIPIKGRSPLMFECSTVGIRDTV